MFRRLQFTFPEGTILYLRWIKLSTLQALMYRLIHARYKNCSFWRCELKPSKHACKIFFNFLKLCVISFFAKKVQFLPPNTLLDAFRMYSRNAIGRNPSMVIPVLANQDLTPMLVTSILNPCTKWFSIVYLS